MFHEGSDGRAVEVARLKRLDLHLPIEVRGRDAAGRAFREGTRTLNISGGGVLFESTSHVELGDKLELRIELPPKLRAHFGGQPEYECRAVVCRVEPRPEGAARVGARFLPTR
jgi:hypothetical protein